MKIHIKSTNTVYNETWMIEMLQRNTKCYCDTKHGKNLTDIDTSENIRLIEACIYHGYSPNGER